MQRRVLIVDDEEAIVSGLRALMEPDGWEVHEAFSAKEAYVQFEMTEPDVVLIDVGLPDASGLDVLDQLKRRSEATAIIIMSGRGRIDQVVQAMQLGAETFLEKPFEHGSLIVALEQVLKTARLRQEIEVLRRGTGTSKRLLGTSPSTLALEAILDDVASAMSPVLLEGESGTGKGVIAGLIHTRSPRARAPFVELNCAGLSKELLESELFGHERGAFTGAVAAKPGLFEVATGGTIFLDEIGELDYVIQAKLLKAIEDKRFRRVGGVHDLQVDVRIIAATNRNLREEVTAGRFRSDLFYRLNVVRIVIPPLRERVEDIPLLAAELLQKLAREMGKKLPRISKRALQALADYPWPGNVRELRNVLERSLLLLHDEEMRIEHLRMEEIDSPVGADPFDRPLKQWEVRPLEEIERKYIRSAVAAVNGNMRKAARLLGISPSTLYAKSPERHTTPR